jgi:hypothetical protein
MELYIWRFPRSTTKNSRRLMRYACIFFVLAQTLMGFSRKGKQEPRKWRRIRQDAKRWLRVSASFSSSLLHFVSASFHWCPEQDGQPKKQAENGTQHHNAPLLTGCTSLEIRLR